MTHVRRFDEGAARGVAALLVAAAASVCCASAPPRAAGLGASGSAAGPAQPASGLEVSAPQGLDAAVQAALVDAAQRTGIGAAALQVTSAERVTWPDGSLGCPQPGVLYTQALVPGYRIRIDAGGQLLDFHASTRGGLVLCPAGRARERLRGDPRV